ncbi:MAG: ABC transporter ATP-binding protein [Gemmatimonadales bacterium]|jgi:Cu-processing system ATP-binding protein
MSARLRVEGLRKRYGRLEVLRGLDVEVPTGRITALVGPNAAGKTTLVKAVLGLLRPDAGRIELDGVVVNGDPLYRERIGYMPQQPAFPDNLRVRELLRFIDGLRGLRGAGTDADDDEPFTRRPRSELLTLFGLEPSLDKPVGTLSGGTRQKVNAAIAFRYDADLLILDEPTAGLDPLGRSRLKDLIRAERERGATVLITSHVLSELRDLADHLVYLVDGRIRFDGSTEELLRRMETDDLERAVACLMEIEAEAGQSRGAPTAAVEAS